MIKIYRGDKNCLEIHFSSFVSHILLLQIESMSSSTEKPPYCIPDGIPGKYILIIKYSFWAITFDLIFSSFFVWPGYDRNWIIWQETGTEPLSQFWLTGTGLAFKNSGSG